MGGGVNPTQPRAQNRSTPPCFTATAAAMFTLARRAQRAVVAADNNMLDKSYYGKCLASAHHINGLADLYVCDILSTSPTHYHI